jgi:hypothetical protein
MSSDAIFQVPVGKSLPAGITECTAVVICATAVNGFFASVGSQSSCAISRVPRTKGSKRTATSAFGLTRNSPSIQQVPHMGYRKVTKAAIFISG